MAAALARAYQLITGVRGEITLSDKSCSSREFINRSAVAGLGAGLAASVTRRMLRQLEVPSGAHELVGGDAQRLSQRVPGKIPLTSLDKEYG